VILQDIQKQIIEAMRAKDKVKLATLRMLGSALNYEKIEKQHELTNDEELAVVAREVKKRKEAIEMYKKAGAVEKQNQEEEELKILLKYLPKQIEDDELRLLVDETLSAISVKDISSMGIIIKKVKVKVGQSADGAKIAQIVKEKLNV